MGFDCFVNRLHDTSGKWNGLTGLDYEHDSIFTPEQLSFANIDISL